MKKLVSYVAVDQAADEVSAGTFYKHDTSTGLTQPGGAGDMVPYLINVLT